MQQDCNSQITKKSKSKKINITGVCTILMYINMILYVNNQSILAPGIQSDGSHKYQHLSSVSESYSVGVLLLIFLCIPVSFYATYSPLKVTPKVAQTL